MLTTTAQRRPKSKTELTQRPYQVWDFSIMTSVHQSGPMVWCIRNYLQDFTVQPSELMRIDGSRKLFLFVKHNSMKRCVIEFVSCQATVQMIRSKQTKARNHSAANRYLRWIDIFHLITLIIIDKYITDSIVQSYTSTKLMVTMTMMRGHNSHIQLPAIPMINSLFLSES